jgi:hypothetical protein
MPPYSPTRRRRSRSGSICATPVRSRITGLTSLQGIDDALKLKKGETIIIHGASGGVGTLAVQFGRLRGAKVFATASGQEGVELAREMGAHVVVDGKRTLDIDDRGRRFTEQNFGGTRRSTTGGAMHSGSSTTGMDWTDASQDSPNGSIGEGAASTLHHLHRSFEF